MCWRQTQRWMNVCVKALNGLRVQRLKYSIKTHFNERSLDSSVRAWLCLTFTLNAFHTRWALAWDGCLCWTCRNMRSWYTDNQTASRQEFSSERYLTTRWGKPSGLLCNCMLLGKKMNECWRIILGLRSRDKKRFRAWENHHSGRTGLQVVVIASSEPMRLFWHNHILVRVTCADENIETVGGWQVTQTLSDWGSKTVMSLKMAAEWVQFRDRIKVFGQDGGRHRGFVFPLFENVKPSFALQDFQICLPMSCFVPPQTKIRRNLNWRCNITRLTVNCLKLAATDITWTLGSMLPEPTDPQKMSHPLPTTQSLDSFTVGWIMTPHCFSPSFLSCTAEKTQTHPPFCDPAPPT